MKLVLQSNLIREQEVSETIEACESQGIEVQPVRIIPFSEELPFDEFTVDDSNFYYGSTTFIHNVKTQLNPRGVFFNPETFTMESSMRGWGGRMLCSDGEITTMEEFASRDLLGTHWFIRPNNDDKSFAGEVMLFDDFREWEEKFQKFDNVFLDKNTKIMACPPRAIEREWRNFIVGDVVAESSLYKECNVLRKSRKEVPAEMISFVQDSFKEYRPSELFVMDVALVDEQYRIIECNCINSSGFYDIDKKSLFSAIREFMDR